MWPLSLPFRTNSSTSHEPATASSESENSHTQNAQPELTVEDPTEDSSETPKIQSDLVLYLDGHDECTLRAHKLHNHFEVSLYSDCVSTNNLEVAIDMFLSSMPAETFQQKRLRLKINTTAIMLPFLFRGGLVDTTMLSFDTLRALCKTTLSKYSYVTTNISYSAYYYTNLYRSNIQQQSSVTHDERRSQDDDEESRVYGSDEQSNGEVVPGEEDNETSTTHEEPCPTQIEMAGSERDTCAHTNKRKASDDLMSDVKRERHGEDE